MSALGCLDHVGDRLELQNSADRAEVSDAAGLSEEAYCEFLTLYVFRYVHFHECVNAHCIFFSEISNI